MTSIDELFKASGVGNKRKLEPLRDPNQVYKSARLTPDGHSSRHARIDEEDTEAGPAPPPPDGAEDEDGDYGPGLPPDDEDADNDDEEGRFFGGGITAQESEVLNYMDEREKDDTNGMTTAAATTAKFDVAWLRKTALNFEKRITRNAEQRARFEGEPQRFIQSEAELDAEVKALSILAEHPNLYPEFARLGCAASLVGLLAHDNTDVAVDAVEIVGELTDEDVAADEAQWRALVDALLDADLLGLLVSNLARLDERNEEVDRAGVYYALGVVENLCSGSGEAARTAERVGAHDGLLRWLLRRIQAKESPVTQNKQYAAEVLAILAQTSAKNRRKLASPIPALEDGSSGDGDGNYIDAVDILLQLAAAYRKRDPQKGDGNEEEYMQNLFEALTCVADEPEGKARFVAAEGVELCLIMLRGEGNSSNKLSRAAALRLLDHATTGPGSAEVCRRLVEAGGLKTAFTLFMKTTKDHNKHKHGHGHDSQAAAASSTIEHLVAIFASLLRRLPADSAERIRTLAKFVERDYEKTARLVQLRREYAARDEAIRLQQQQAQKARKAQGKMMTAEEEAAMADEWFSRRLDAGLFTLQTLDVALAWLVAEDGGAADRIRRLLAERDETLAVVRDTIQEQIEGMDDDDGDGDAADGEGGRGEETRESREMLSTLVQFLQ
ncbi:hypothetical protein SLS62_009036 [Diatrype stigma]|uniref:Beta-catenin-like protein 1 N-terminal domain-containing protein n=1 Tax=Diatrype stigma TaxID=117547 RepID=A0AAN9UJG7_9PEZI